MKTYQLIYMAMATACLSLSACSNQEELAVAEKKVPLEIAIKGCTTRSIISGNTLPNDSQLGIYAVNTDNVIAYKNILATATDNVWKMAEPIYLTELEKHIYAYYPYNEATEFNNLPIDAREQTDYLYGYAVNANNMLTTVNASNPKADILLKHAMARITLNIKKSANNVTEQGTVLQAILAGVPLTSSLDIRSGEMKTAMSGDLVIATKVALSMEGENVDILVPPTETEVVLSLNINEKYHSIKMPAIWEAGQQYTYTVEITNNSLAVSEATIAPWENNLQDGIEVGDENYVEN